MGTVSTPPLLPPPSCKKRTYCLSLSPQLFYLIASSYQAQCKTVEMLRQRGLDIYWTFFLDHAPLQLASVDEAIKLRICKSLTNTTGGESTPHLSNLRADNK